MLLGQMEVSVGNLVRKHKSVMLHASRFSQLLKSLGTKHLPQSIRCIYSTIDDDMGDVDSLRGKLRVERLAEQSSPPMVAAWEC